MAERQAWFGAKRHVKSLLATPALHPLVRAAATAMPNINASGRLPAPAGLREVTGEVLGHRFVLLEPARCILAKELYWGRGRRPHPADQHALELFARLSGDASHVLDVGAYTGIFSVVAALASPSAVVEAFEMVPDVHAHLLRNLERNGLSGRVRAHRVALGAPGGTIVLPERASGSALPDFYSRSAQFASGVPIPVVALDAEASISPEAGRVLVKLDVEETEHEVLAHAEDLLRVHRPDVLCEVLPTAVDPVALDAQLAAHAYRRYLVRDADVEPRERLVPDPRHRDWLFTTREPAELSALGIRVAR